MTSERSTCSDEINSCINCDNNITPNTKRALEQDEQGEALHLEKKLKTDVKDTELLEDEKHELARLENNSLTLNSNDSKRESQGENTSQDEKTKTEDSSLEVQESDQTNKDNLPRKRKCALLLSYCGAGYNGMQMAVTVGGDWQ
ncbi:hypothetical protein QZH41_001086 [Actinostola sp. cb2023]|nr:hypothetical protein QZH41_001086 [Actinostola sp. cb2023]